MKYSFYKYVVTVILMLSAITATAFDFECDGLYYTITSVDDATVEVAPSEPGTVTYNQEDIVVPAVVSYNGKDYEVIGIGEYAFYISSVRSVTLPSTIIYVGAHAFDYAYNLTEIELPSNLERIGDAAFSGCAFVEVTIPSSVFEIGAGAFAGNVRLRTFNVEQENQYFSSFNGILYNKDGSVLVACPGGYDTQLDVPSGVVAIGDGAFYSCQKIPQVTLPDGLRAIGKSAFYYCASLTSVVVPDNVSVVDDHAFEGCYSLADVRLGAGLESLGDNAFGGCPLSSIVLPASLKSVGGGAFLNCSSLSSVAIPAGVSYIGSEAFSGCALLKSITVDGNNDTYCDIDGILYSKDGKTLIQCPGGYSGSVTIGGLCESVGDYAFYSCQWLRQLQFPSSVRSIGNYSFTSCALAELELGSGLEFIGEGAFSSCIYLKNISIPNKVRHIGMMAFYGCSYVEELNLGAAIEEIDDMAFGYLTRITTVTLPSSLKTIGERVFSGCPLTTVFAEGCVPPEIKVSMFDDACYAAATLYVPESSVDIYKSDGLWAEFSDIRGYVPAGIGWISNAPQCGSAYYSVGGMARKGNGKGLTIVRMPDGSMVKRVSR